MNCKVEVLKRPNVDEKLAAKLRSLSFSHQGRMCESFRACNKENVVFVVRQGEMVLGWALLVKFNVTTPDCMIYVRQSHRRLGIGSTLFRTLKDYALREWSVRNVDVYPWDATSSQFYSRQTASTVQERYHAFTISI